MKKTAAAAEPLEKAQRTITFTWHCLLELEEGMGWEEAEPEHWWGSGDTCLLETPAHPRRRHPAACHESLTGSAAGQQSTARQFPGAPTASSSATLRTLFTGQEEEISEAEMKAFWFRQPPIQRHPCHLLSDLETSAFLGRAG